jgi:structural maintenance of chromosome 3 (chondroitin sulfate proteoglycan 6)
MEDEAEKSAKDLQDHRTSLEKIQIHQAEDSRSITRQQKNTERYLAKRQMLINRKDECNRNIRDLGVLPEEAFEKYTGEKRVDKVSNYAYRYLLLRHQPSSFTSL